MFSRGYLRLCWFALIITCLFGATSIFALGQSGSEGSVVISRLQTPVEASSRVQISNC